MRRIQKSRPIIYEGGGKSFVICPFCGQRIEFDWYDDQLIYWKPKNTCHHFKGAYAGIKQDYALFENFRTTAGVMW